MLSVRKLTCKKMWKHLRTVQTHRKWVRKYCFLVGIPWRGIKHDLSKYSPTEFFESARYWIGTGSPINEAKEENGVSYAWMHHKGRNSHHYEYWMDNFDDGGIARLMPKDDFTELVCDYLGAARAYLGDKFSYHKEKEWWANKREKTSMNEQNKTMLDIIFSDLDCAEQIQQEIDDNPYAKNRYRLKCPEKLLSTRYIQEVWEANKEEVND